MIAGRDVRSAFGPAGGLGERVADDLLEFLEIRDESRASFRAEAVEGLRPAAFGAAPGFDQPGLLQYVDVTAQVAVGERAEAFQLGEDRSLGPRHERRHDPEPRLFVKDAVEPFVGVAPGLVAMRVLSRHAVTSVPGSTRARRRP